MANCQSIVTWHYVQQAGWHFPIVGELYLPKSWTQDKQRLKRSGVPKVRFGFKKKWELVKEELGLDHFEGRSWLGLHHHMTLCFMAYGFLQLLRQSTLKKQVLFAKKIYR